MRGYDVFVKSVSSEILRSNPEARADPAEVQRIVQNEWLMLSEEKRQMYEQISGEKSTPLTKLEEIES